MTNRGFADDEEIECVNCDEWIYFSDIDGKWVHGELDNVRCYADTNAEPPESCDCE